MDKRIAEFFAAPGIRHQSFEINIRDRTATGTPLYRADFRFQWEEYTFIEVVCGELSQDIDTTIETANIKFKIRLREWRAGQVPPMRPI